MNDHDPRRHYQQSTLFDPQPETRAANRVLRLLTDHDLPDQDRLDREPDGLGHAGVTDNNNDKDGDVGEWW